MPNASLSKGIGRDCAVAPLHITIWIDESPTIFTVIVLLIAAIVVPVAEPVPILKGLFPN